jgi:hypothetical protein
LVEVKVKAAAWIALSLVGLGAPAFAASAEPQLSIVKYKTPEQVGPQGLSLAAPAQFTETDWSTWDHAIIDVQSSKTQTVQVIVTLRNQKGGEERGESAGFTANLVPGANVHWTLPLFPLVYTERWEFPLQKQITWAGGWGHLDPLKVAEISVAVDETWTTGAITVSALRLEGKAEHHAWIDQWGQDSKGTWPNKITKDEDLVEADRKELAALKAAPQVKDRDQYQGWTGAPARKATGFFRTEKIDGRWWLVTPTGRLYFMTGLDCVGPGSHARNGEAIRDAYSWLPPKEGLFKAAWLHPGQKNEIFSMYRANLIRKWGKDFEAEWLKRMPLRMQAWGFSSIGNWSDDEVTDTHILPYVVMGPDTWSEVPYVSKNLQDAFHPGFAAHAKKASEKLAQRYKADPWLIGYFVGNEMDWREMPVMVLEKAASVPSKQRFLEILKKKYGSVDKVNAVWATQAANWDALRLPKEGKRWTPAQTEDAAAFRGEFAELWFKTWNTALKAADPNHLFLGSRIHGGGNRSDEVIAASGRYCDVVSFNEYSLRPDPIEYAKWAKIADKPYIVGEYTFNSLDDGLLAGAVPVLNREERGKGYSYYTEQMAANPNFVGGHFFQFTDEPITGREDRETSYNGFVRVTDSSDPNLVGAAMRSNSRAEAIHAGLLKPMNTPPRRF